MSFGVSFFVLHKFPDYVAVVLYDFWTVDAQGVMAFLMTTHASLRGVPLFIAAVLTGVGVRAVGTDCIFLTFFLNMIYLVAIITVGEWS